MLTTYHLTLDGRADPVTITTDQRDLFALRRHGYKECGYDSAEAAMAVFNQASGGALPDAALAAVGLEALTTISWLVWHSAHRNELTASDFDTFCERELIAMSPVVDANGNGDAARPTTSITSAGGSPGSPS